MPTSRPDWPRLREELINLDGRTCAWPHCPAPGAEVAHLTHRGMGGTSDPTINEVGNLALLCTYHHNLLDGRTTMSRRYEIGLLLRGYLREVRSAFETD